MHKFTFLILKVWQCLQQLEENFFFDSNEICKIPTFNFVKHCRAGARQAYCQVVNDCLRRRNKKKGTIGNSIGHNATITHVMATSMQNLQIALLYLRSIQLPSLLDFETLKDMCLPSKSIIARREQWLTSLTVRELPSEDHTPSPWRHFRFYQLQLFHVCRFS